MSRPSDRSCQRSVPNNLQRRLLEVSKFKFLVLLFKKNQLFMCNFTLSKCRTQQRMNIATLAFIAKLNFRLDAFIKTVCNEDDL